MLEHEELQYLINKERLSLIDVELMGGHVEYISNLKDEYMDDLPPDVFDTLQGDLRLIIARLEQCRKNLIKIQTKVKLRGIKD